MTEQVRLDPRTAYPRPPFPRQTDGRSGAEDEINPRPDHGEESYIGAGRLAGLRSLVTGADSGIGRAVAIAFAREGADVAIGYHRDEEDAAATARFVEEAGRRAHLAPGDVSSEADCRRIVRQAHDALGGLDVLVNNAATQVERERIEDVPTDEWERIVRTNLTALFWITREAVGLMEAGSSIINVASIQATHPSPNLLAYATTKGGIVTFSKALSAMLAPRGIRVNVVAPGPVWTPLVTTTTDPDDLVQFGADAAFGRPAQPVELAGAFVYLASSAASYVTGAVIPVTGGEIYA